MNSVATKNAFDVDGVEVIEPGLVEVEIDEIKLIDADDKKKSQTTLLIEIGKQSNLFHDVNGDAFSELDLDGIKATMPVRSRDFREYLSHELYKLIGKGASSTAITDSINTFEAKAKFSGNKITVAVRTHKAVNSIFIDMGSSNRKIIEITKLGWRYTNNAPIKFVQKRGMTELPEPEKNGNINLLKKYLNVKMNELPLIYGWLFCALAGVKPYPILILQGEQGTGKSTTSRLLRMLVDPSSVLLRSPPKDTRDLLVSAANTHAIVLDNLSGLKPEISDCLCRLSTGGGIDVRALFTDGEQYLIDIQKPVLVNGIDDIAARPDLSERALIINLPIIESGDRRSEHEFWNEFDNDKAQIFTGLLQSLASGLKHVNDIVLSEKPRMVDVARWVTACEKDSGMKGEFLTSHLANQAIAVESGIEASPVGSAIAELMTGCKKWSGTPTKLFETLENIAGYRQASSRSWPQSTKGLNNSIKRLMPSFRKLGIEITKQNSGNRGYTLENIGIYPPQPPEPPEDTSGMGCMQGGYKKQTPAKAVKCQIMADSISNRREPNQGKSTPLAVRADRADRNQHFLNKNDTEVF